MYDASHIPPLIIACLDGSKKIIRSLLLAGANVNRHWGKNRDIRPLSVLYELGDIVTTKEFLKRGAAIDCIPPPPFDFDDEDCFRDVFGPPEIPSDIVRRKKRIQKLLTDTRLRRERIRITVKLSFDLLKKQGHGEVVARTPNNNLPPHLFVFKVVEMMKMCAMEPLAEHLIEFMGNC